MFIKNSGTNIYKVLGSRKFDWNYEFAVSSLVASSKNKVYINAPVLKLVLAYSKHPVIEKILYIY